MTGSSHIVIYGAIAGCIPTVSMILASLFGKKVDFTPTFQAMAQNLCAGLILGAVAMELFPNFRGPTYKDNLVGITVGFFISLFFINFLDFLVEWTEKQLETLTEPTTSKPPETMVNPGSPDTVTQVAYQSINEIELNELVESAADTDARPILELANQSMQSEAHREKIRQKMTELLDSIDIIQNKSELLIAHKTVDPEDPAVRRPSWQLMNNEEEKHADEIDEQIHRLQYNLDHCRRLVQGCESNIIGIVPRLWITEDGKASLITGLDLLKQDAKALVAFLSLDQPTTQSLVDIHRTMCEMDNYITKLHDTVEEYSFKWGRRGHRGAMASISAGSTIPMSLMLPVTVDCIVDGFMVGITCSISVRAGFILAMANCIEMGFLGLAVALRIKQCTASSSTNRYAALVLPPLLMLVFSVLGAFIGNSARSIPMVFIGIISFGVVCLLYLVVNELVVEARETLEGNEQWWSGMVLFFGIYVVLLLDMFVQ